MHVVPRRPHAFDWVPGSHLPAASQQPLQVLSHLALGAGPHEGAQAATHPTTIPVKTHFIFAAVMVFRIVNSSKGPENVRFMLKVPPRVN